MTRKEKFSDEQIIELIEQGLNNAEIARKLGCTPGNLNHRIKELRKHNTPLITEKEFDLSKYDTVTKLGRWYRVTEVTENDFTIKRIDGVPGRDAAVTFTKAEYIKGQTGLNKKEFSKVTSYVDPNLKNADEIENVNETDETDIEKANPVTEPCDSVVVTIDSDNPDYIDPEWGVTPSQEGSFEERIVAEAKRDADKYSSIKTKFIDDVSKGKRLVLEDVIRYNNLVTKYGA